MRSGAFAACSITWRKVARPRDRSVHEGPPRQILSGPRNPEQAAKSAYQNLDGYLDRLDQAGLGSRQRVLGSPGPRMLTLAADLSAGALPLLTTPRHTKLARISSAPGRCSRWSRESCLTPTRRRGRLAACELWLVLTREQYVPECLDNGRRYQDPADGRHRHRDPERRVTNVFRDHRYRDEEKAGAEQRETAPPVRAVEHTRQADSVPPGPVAGYRSPRPRPVAVVR